MAVNHFPMSPAELLSTYLKSQIATDLAAGRDAGLAVTHVKPGPVPITKQKEGSASIVEAGRPRLEPNLPILWQRLAVRCSGEKYADADRIGNYVRDLCDKFNRIAITQPSNGKTYLIHTMDVTAGNTVQVADQKTFETIQYVQLSIGTDEIS